MKFNEFAWDGLTRLLKRALTWTGVQTFDSLVATTADINAGTVDAVVGGTTPAAGEFTTLKNTGKVHHVLSAGFPMLIGGDDIATLTGVTISNANPSVLTKDATIDDGLAVGDAVVVNSGTNATVGTYIVASIVVNTSVTLDRQAATGACTDGNVTYMNDPTLLVTNDDGVIVKPSIRMTDGLATSIIKHVQEAGLGGRLTIGLDETARTMMICDAGDIDTDFALTVQDQPRLYVFNAAGSLQGALAYDTFRLRAGALIVQHDGSQSLFEGWNTPFVFRVARDIDAGDIFTFQFASNGREMVDTDGEQSFVCIKPEVNQSGTAAYNGLKIKVTETALGDGTTGEGAPGNNLILAGTSTDPDMFKVDNVGRIILAESSDPTALADHAFLIAKDAAGTGNLYAGDAAADMTLLSPHHFDLFQPDPNEAFPWAYHSTNTALGKKINVDMAGAIRAIEEATGKTFIYYEDIPVTQDLEVQYRAQWENDWIKDNTTEEEVVHANAFEMVEEDERVLYEVVDSETGKVTKQGKKLGEEITGYELVGDEVKPKIEIIWETRKVMKSQLKEDVRFGEMDGKFYKKVIPTKAMAETAAVEGFIFVPPVWMAEKLAAIKAEK